MGKRKRDFSVLMCVYAKDHPNHFKLAIESIISQTAKPSEIVLVVDGPIPEKIQGIIQRTTDKFPQLKTIYLKKNIGHGEARRVGLENCQYPLVAIMDADDISLPQRFEKQLDCFNSDPELSIVGGNIKEFIDDTSNIVGVRKVPQFDNEIKEYMKSRCPFNQLTVMFKKADIDSVGGYVDWYHNEDYYLWIRLFQHDYKFRNIDECLCYARVGSEMYSRRGGWKYFRSEVKLQKYMLDNEIISILRFSYNVLVRFVVQVMMPNKLRGLVFQKFARSREEQDNQET